jgi:hypothetical protein
MRGHEAVSGPLPSPTLSLKLRHLSQLEKVVMLGASLVLTGSMSVLVAVTSAAAPIWHETCGEKV